MSSNNLWDQNVYEKPGSKEYLSNSPDSLKLKLSKEIQKNEALESRWREAEYELTIIKQEHKQKEGELLSQIEDLENQLKFSEKLLKSKSKNKEESYDSEMINQLEQKLSEYENKFVSMKENETKFKFELNELKQSNNEFKLKLDRYKQRIGKHHKRNNTQAEEFNNIFNGTERLSTLGFMAGMGKKLLNDAEGSDESEIFESSQCTPERQERSTVSHKSNFKNKYYKKYAKYKALANEQQIQLQEMKDRAISSLVEKEKKIIQVTQEYDEVVSKLKSEIK